MANYQDDKPAAADQLNQSQADIQQNFEAIDDLINVDHEDFAGGAGDEGKHKQVTFTLSADDPATLVDEMAIYNKGNALFVQPQNQVAGTDGIDFTTLTGTVTGSCGLPCGVILKWGTGTIAIGSANVAVAFGANFPTAIFRVFLTPTGTLVGHNTIESQIISSSGSGVGGFTAYRSTAGNLQTDSVVFNYLAIGN